MLDQMPGPDAWLEMSLLVTSPLESITLVGLPFIICSLSIFHVEFERTVAYPKIDHLQLISGGNFISKGNLMSTETLCLNFSTAPTFKGRKFDLTAKVGFFEDSFDPLGIIGLNIFLSFIHLSTILDSRIYSEHQMSVKVFLNS